jgi:hypothetical protein
VEANLANQTRWAAGEDGARLKFPLAAQELRLPILGNNDDTTNSEYIKHFVLDYDSRHLRGVPSDRELGRPYGLEWAEAFHYIGPPESTLDRYTAEHAVPL